MIKKSDGRVDAYSLLIQSADNKSHSQITFLYPLNASQLVAISALQLAKSWNFTAAKEGAGVLEGDGCRYYFNFKSPFKPEITTYKP